MNFLAFPFSFISLVTNIYWEFATCQLLLEAWGNKSKQILIVSPHTDSRNVVSLLTNEVTMFNSSFIWFLPGKHIIITTHFIYWASWPSSLCFILQQRMLKLEKLSNIAEKWPSWGPHWGWQHPFRGHLPFPGHYMKWSHELPPSIFTSPVGYPEFTGEDGVSGELGSLLNLTLLVSQACGARRGGAPEMKNAFQVCPLLNSSVTWTDCFLPVNFLTWNMGVL